MWYSAVQHGVRMGEGAALGLVDGYVDAQRGQESMESTESTGRAQSTKRQRVLCAARWAQHGVGLSWWWCVEALVARSTLRRETQAPHVPHPTAHTNCPAFPQLFIC